MKTAKIVEFSELGTYALEYGCIWIDSKDGLHYVYKRGTPLPVATCRSHWEAVRVACDLAIASETAEGWV
jgi:hypothetical protein